jgi:hypothetical protein
VFIENNPGLAAGFSNDNYKVAGANICQNSSSDPDFSQLFDNQQIIPEPPSRRHHDHTLKKIIL